MKESMETKHCPGCDLDKPVGEFSKNRAKPDGLQNYCKTCASFAVQMSKRNSRKTQEHQKKLKRLTLYGLTAEDYELMVFEQNNKCPVCRREMDQPQVDYDPETGELMALLCNDCRSAKTLLRNDLELIYRLSAYVESYKADSSAP